MYTYLLARRKAYSVQHPVNHAQYHKSQGVTPVNLTDRTHNTPSSQVSSHDTAGEPLEHAGRDVSSLNCIHTLPANVPLQAESMQYYFFLIITETFEILVEDPNRSYTLMPFKIWLKSFVFTFEVKKARKYG